MKIKNIEYILGMMLVMMAFSFSAVQPYIVSASKTITITPAYSVELETNVANVVAGNDIVCNGNLTYKGTEANKTRELIFNIYADEDITVGYNDNNLQDINYPEVVFDDSDAFTISSTGANFGKEYPWFAYSCTNQTADSFYSKNYVSCYSNLTINGSETKNFSFAFETHDMGSATYYDVEVLLR